MDDRKANGPHGWSHKKPIATVVIGTNSTLIEYCITAVMRHMANAILIGHLLLDLVVHKKYASGYAICHTKNQ